MLLEHDPATALALEDGGRVEEQGGSEKEGHEQIPAQKYLGWYQLVQIAADNQSDKSPHGGEGEKDYFRLGRSCWGKSASRLIGKKNWSGQTVWGPVWVTEQRQFPRGILQISFHYNKNYCYLLTTQFWGFWPWHMYLSPFHTKKTKVHKSSTEKI